MNIMVSIKGNFTKYIKAVCLLLTIIERNICISSYFLGKIFSIDMCSCVNKKKRKLAFRDAYFSH